MISLPRRAARKFADVVIDALVYVVVWGLVAVALALVVVAFRGIDHHVSGRACRKWGRETGREVRFVDVNFFDFPCLVKTSDGRWLDKGQLRDVAP